MEEGKAERGGEVDWKRGEAESNEVPCAKFFWGVGIPITVVVSGYDHAIGLGARLKFEYPGTGFSSTIITGESQIQSLLLKTIEYPGTRYSIGRGINLIICFKFEYQ